MERIEISLQNYRNRWITNAVNFSSVENSYSEFCQFDVDHNLLKFRNLTLRLPYGYSSLSFALSSNDCPKKIQFENCCFLDYYGNTFKNSLIGTANHSEVSFVDCEFDFLNQRNLGLLEFKNCQIENTQLSENLEIKIQNSQLGNLVLNKGTVLGSLEFEDNAERTIKLLNVEIEKNLKFNKANGTVKLDGIKLQKGNLTLTHSFLTGDSYLTDIHCEQVEIHNNSSGEIILSHLSCGSLKIYRNECNIDISSASIHGSIKLNEHYGNNLFLSDIDVEENLNITEANTWLKLNKVKLPKGDLTLRNSNIDPESSIIDIECNYMAIQDSSGHGIDLQKLNCRKLSLYRNQSNLTLSNSSINKAKINLNRNDFTTIDNTTFKEEATVKGNSTSEINLINIDLSNTSLEGNSGDLSITAIPSGILPDLTANEFSNIEFKDIAVNEHWDLKVAESQAVSFESVALTSLIVEADKLDQLQLKDCNTPLHINIKQCLNFDLLEHECPGNIDVHFQYSEIVNVNECICTSFNIELDNNENLSINRLKAEFKGLVKNGEQVKMTSLLESQNSTLETDHIKEVTLNSIGCDYLNLSIGNCDTLKLEECHKSVSSVDDNLSTPNRTGDNYIKIIADNLSKLNINTCYSQLIEVKESDIEVLTMDKNKSKSLEITESNVGEVDINTCAYNSLKIKSTLSSKIRFDYLNKVNTSYGKLDYLFIEHSDLEQILFNHQSLNKVSIKNLRSRYLDFADSTIGDLYVLSSNSKVFDLGRIDTKRNNPEGWFIPNTPSNTCEIVDCNISQLRMKDGSNEGKYNLKECEIDFCVAVDFNSKLFSTEHSEFNKFALVRCHAENGKAIELVSQRDQIGQFKISGCVAVQAIYNSTIDALKVYNNSILEVFEMEECNDDRIDYAVKSIALSNSKIDSIKLTESSIQELSIKNVKPLEFLSRKLKLENLSFESFKQRTGSGQDFEMRKVNTNSNHKAKTLTFTDSDLSGIKFNSCYFNTFNNLHVAESKLDEIKCTATTWPKAVTAPKGEAKHFEIREACRQLKLAMTAHQDKVSELQFHALEMKAYQQIVKKRGWVWDNINDRLTLWAGASNKFGLNWFKPVWILVVSMFVLYFSIIGIHYQLHPFQASFYDCITWADFFTLYNPTHRISQLSLGTQIGGWVAFIDFLSKIISAFFIYQVVAAFRRFKRG